MLGITRTNDSGNLLEEKKDAGQGLLQRVFDNLRRSQKYATRAIVDMVQSYYTEPRVLRYTAVDGEKTEEVAINQVNAANNIVNDVSVGRYDIVITWAPKADVLDDYEFDKMVRMKEVGIDIPDYILVGKTQLTNKAELVAVLRRQAGLDKTEEELQIDATVQQINMAKMQLELQEIQSKIQVNTSVAQLNNANTYDITNIAPQQFIMGILADKESDQLNAGLRTALSQGSNDTTVLKTILNNNAKAAEQPKLGAPESSKTPQT